jgi:hypothetical protein
VTREAAFLARPNQFRSRIEGRIDMPDRTTDLLFRFRRWTRDAFHGERAWVNSPE